MNMKAAKRSRRTGKGGFKKGWKKRMSRQLLAELVLQKQLADKLKDNVASCATRTVEWPSTHRVAEEKSKLLFALALGLIPKFDKKVEPSLTVNLERLHPSEEARARSTTKSRIFNLVENSRNTPQFIEITPDFPSFTETVPDHDDLIQRHLLPEVEEPRVSPEIVEFIDLASDDEDSISIAESAITTPPLSSIESENYVLSTESYKIVADLASDEDDSMVESPFTTNQINPVTQQTEEIVDLTLSDDESDSTEHPDSWRVSRKAIDNLTILETSGFPLTPSPSPERCHITKPMETSQKSDFRLPLTPPNSLEGMEFGKILKQIQSQSKSSEAKTKRRGPRRGRSINKITLKHNRNDGGWVIEKEC